MVSRNGFIAILIFISVSLAFAQSGETMAILDFDALGISQVEASVITSRLRTELVNVGRIKIIERGSMQEILVEQNFQLLGCTSDECAVEVGKLLNVNYMVAGTIGRLGGLFTIDARIIQVESGQIFRTVSRDYSGSIEGLLGEVRIMANLITPQTADDQLVTTAEDVATAITLTGSDPDGGALTYSYTAPAHGTLSGLAPRLTYTPDGDYNGSDAFTFTVNEGAVESDPATVSITVTSVNDNPVITSGASDSAIEDVLFSYAAAATDVDGDNVTLSFIGYPSWLTASGTTLSGTPGQGNGDSAFTVTADDGNGGSDILNVSVSVQTVNDAAAAGIAVTPQEDSAISASNDPGVLATRATSKTKPATSETEYSSRVIFRENGIGPIYYQGEELDRTRVITLLNTVQDDDVQDALNVYGSMERVKISCAVLLFLQLIGGGVYSESGEKRELPEITASGNKIAMGSLVWSVPIFLSQQKSERVLNAAIERYNLIVATN